MRVPVPNEFVMGLPIPNDLLEIEQNPEVFDVINAVNDNEMSVEDFDNVLQNYERLNGVEEPYSVNDVVEQWENILETLPEAFQGQVMDQDEPNSMANMASSTSRQPAAYQKPDDIWGAHRVKIEVDSDVDSEDERGTWPGYSFNVTPAENQASPVNNNASTVKMDDELGTMEGVEYRGVSSLPKVSNPAGTERSSPDSK